MELAIVVGVIVWMLVRLIEGIPGLAPNMTVILRSAVLVVGVVVVAGVSFGPIGR
jgi:hypothetical protein